MNWSYVRSLARPTCTTSGAQQSYGPPVGQQSCEPAPSSFEQCPLVAPAGSDTRSSLQSVDPFVVRAWTGPANRIARNVLPAFVNHHADPSGSGLRFVLSSPGPNHTRTPRELPASL